MGECLDIPRRPHVIPKVENKYIPGLEKKNFHDFEMFASPTKDYDFKSMKHLAYLSI